ncbi:HD domain-containing phosphohydrolase [Microbacterium sp. 2MCAF23]|uniref:HD domain-containing phosphohydrolase n=1 Tax=Microbacterium sp. 2MCAF23 TaxID=3232985 RepID=UPI003F9CC73A
MSLALQDRVADNGPVGATAGAPTRGEMIAAVSVAIDLGLGQPAEHMMRAALLADRLAARLGLDDGQRGTAYQATLLMWIGCTADSQEYARWFGDDIAVRSASYLVDWSGLPFLRFLVEHVAEGRSPVRRAATLAELMIDSRGRLGALLHSHCLSAALLAERLGLPRAVQEAVSAAFERYDGRGLPRGLAGEEIPIAMRIAQLADTAEVHDRLGGAEAAVRMARERRGGQFDPLIVDAFTADAAALLDIPHGSAAWRAALECAPDRDDVLHGDALDAAVAAIGDFADLKCPFLLGHSRGVAEIVGAAAREIGVPADEVATLRRAAHLHDIGRLGVSNLIWSKPDVLDDGDWERVRMHPYLGGRVLARIPGLAAESALVRAHHEHLDGSGYPAGVPGTSLTRSDRLLAAAVAFRAAIEPRPYRAALEPGEAIERLRRRVAAGHLDGEAVAAVAAAATGGTGARRTRPPLPAGLTPREAEILTLVAQGRSNREIAAVLTLSEKTVRNHVEHTYAKIGVANRVGASLFAIDHGFIGRPV